MLWKSLFTIADSASSDTIQNFSASEVKFNGHTFIAKCLNLLLVFSSSDRRFSRSSGFSSEGSFYPQRLLRYMRRADGLCLEVPAGQAFIKMNEVKS